MHIRVVPVSLVALTALLAACGSKAAAPLSAPVTTAGTTTVAPAGGGQAAASVQGGQAAGQSGQDGNAANGDRRAALQAYRDCLTSHGVTLPSNPNRPANGNGQAGGDPNGPPPGADPNGPPPSDQNGPPPGADPNGPPATDATGNPVPRGGFGGGLQSVINDPANKAAVDACASLLPAGGFGAGPGGGQRGGQAFQAYLSCLRDNGVDIPTTTAPGPPPSFDRSSPAFTAANEKCQVLLPQRGNGQSGQGGASTQTTTTVVN